MTELTRKIADGRLARLGLLDGVAIDAAAKLVSTVQQNDLETVRVLFADQHGVLRGKTIVAKALISAFTSGIAAPSTLLLKDTSHRTVFPIWDDVPDITGMKGAGDILLLPDPSTFRTLPWAPQSAWIFCTPRRTDGSAIPFAPRDVLQSAIDRLSASGRALMVGLEVEFHVFQKLDDRLAHRDATMPAQPARTANLGHGYQFLTESRYDAAEEVLDDLRRNAQALGLPVRSVEIEMGPSQFEFTFDPADPMTHADNMMMFRAMVKETCERKGLHATFMCKPNVENGAASGWHLHQSLVDPKSGVNLMIPDDDGTLSADAQGWIAGLLEHAAESCLLTTPTVNGYKRFRPHQLAPDRIQWARDNRGAMIRALMTPGDTASRVENRVAETTANPYYFFASQILSGIDGIERGLPAPAPVETPYSGNAPRLPESLLSAIQLFESSAFYRGVLGDIFVDYLSHIRRSEWNRYHLAVSEWEQAEYFGIY